MDVRTLVEYDRTPPAAWSAAVAACAPPDTGLSWFHLAWEPGDAWQPIGRWVIWNMRPKGRVPTIHRPALAGPHPRSTGHWCASGWCACALKANGWTGAPPSAHGIDRLTWELYHQTGCYGQRWWVVQGTNGGHRFTLDGVEKKLLKLHTGVSDTPAAGDLPYADVDRRVLAHLRAHDKVALWKQALRFAERSDAQLSGEVQAEVERARLQLLAWLDNQTDLLWDTEGARIRRIIADTPRIPGFKDTTDRDADLEAYITAPSALA